MQVHILAVGRLKDGPERSLLDMYLDRASAQGRAASLTGFEVRSITESSAQRAADRKKQEGEALLAATPEGGNLIALDERGRSVTSRELAARIGDWRDNGSRNLTCIIGGADGLSSSVIDRADLVLGLSALTWPHQLVRIMLAEQLYRVTTILTSHPYHRD